MALMALAGMQFLLVLLYIAITGKPLAQTNWVNEMVVTWAISLLWVPHHVTGFLVAWVALLAILDASRRWDGRESMSRVVGPTALAAAGFASAFGASTWVTFGLVAGVGLWGIVLLRERRWPTLAIIAAAGVTSLVMAAPHMVDLLAGRESTKAALALGVRRFSLVQIFMIELAARGIAPPGLDSALRLITLPVNYFFEFGLIGLGALAFWARKTRAAAHRTEEGLLLTLTAAGALVIGTFVKSNIGNNDLGWRVLLFTQVAMLLWTAHLLEPVYARLKGRWPTLADIPPALRMASIVGLIGISYDLANLRLQVPLNLPLPSGDIRNARVDLDTRRAFEWLTANGERHWIVQHNPNVYSALGHALYGRNRVAVADRHNGPLLGADPDVVERRLDDVLPLFKADSDGQSVKAVAHKHRIDVLLVASTDPVWKAAPRWLRDSPALFTSAHVRFYRTDQVIP
jgi:hypothetical protein